MLRYYFYLILIISFTLATSGCGQTKAEQPSIDEKIGQMLKVGFRGLEVDDESPIMQDIKKYHMGGVVLFDYDVPRDTALRNIASPEQVQKLTQDLQQATRTPLLIAIDQEGGRVARLKPKYGFEPTVSAQYLGSLQNADSTEKYANRTGQILSELGINTNLAPVVDVNINPENPVIGGIERSFSEDPEVVAKQANIYIQTLHQYGIITTLKHFPGHGSSKDDSHLGVVDVTEHWQQKELTPYKKLIKSGQILSELGINTNLAPVVDVNINPENPVIGGIERSFSEDPEVVTKQANIYIQTLHQYGIITTLKHFPGHGSSKDDSHLGVVDVTEYWQQKELTPYKQLIESGEADIVMTAHIFNAKLDSTYPATLSKPIITGILRDSLGFDGVVMSDDLQMKAIRTQYGLKETIKLSLLAGVDMLSFANNSIFDEEIAAKAHRIIKELIDEGVITEDRIDVSYQRITKLKRKYLISTE